MQMMAVISPLCFAGVMKRLCRRITNKRAVINAPIVACGIDFDWFRGLFKHLLIEKPKKEFTYCVIAH